MARRFSVSFDIEFTEETLPVDAASLVSQALDADFDHTAVFVQPLDEVDGFAIGDWVTDDEGDDEV